MHKCGGCGATLRFNVRDGSLILKTLDCRYESSATMDQHVDRKDHSMKLILWLASIALMASCGMLLPQVSTGLTQAPSSKYRFDYNLTNAEPIALLRVFDDSGSTFLQFKNEVPDGLVVSAETASSATVIPHETMGNYAILRGVYRGPLVFGAISGGWKRPPVLGVLMQVID